VVGRLWQIVPKDSGGIQTASQVFCPSYLMHPRPGTIRLPPSTLRAMQDCRKAQEAQASGSIDCIGPGASVRRHFQTASRPPPPVLYVCSASNAKSHTLSLSSLQLIIARSSIYSMTLHLSHHRAPPPARLSAPSLFIQLRTLYPFSPVCRTRSSTLLLPETQRRGYRDHTCSKTDSCWSVYAIQGLRYY